MAPSTISVDSLVVGITAINKNKNGVCVEKVETIVNNNKSKIVFKIRWEDIT
eukprot:Awhi_evm1s3513